VAISLQCLCMLSWMIFSYDSITLLLHCFLFPLPYDALDLLIHFISFYKARHVLHRVAMSHFFHFLHIYSSKGTTADCLIRASAYSSELWPENLSCQSFQPCAFLELLNFYTLNSTFFTTDSKITNRSCLATCCVRKCDISTTQQWIVRCQIKSGVAA
jgi:hypothetical protein